MATTTRGIRNNNPLNVRRGSSWKGLSKFQNDKEFCQFESMVYGIRSALVVLRTYAYKYKINNLLSVINRYAPAKDKNNPSSYCYLVRTYLLANLPLDSPYRTLLKQDKDTLLVNKWLSMNRPSEITRFLVKAMAIVESNYNISDEELEEAISLL